MPRTRYLRSKFAWLLTQPAVRENPALASARLARWLLFCAAGHSPCFELGDGVRCKVDPVLRESGASSAFVLRRWAEPELRHLHEMLGQGGAFIDCGANIGIYALCAAPIVGPLGTVIAIEPGEASFRRLRANIELNGFARVVAVNKAISDVDGVARLYHGGLGPVSYSLIKEDGEEFEKVTTTTIDRLVAEVGLGRLDAIKIDVRGVKIRVIQGAHDTLVRFKPVLIFDREKNDEPTSDAAKDLPDIIRSYGYRMYEFRAGRLRQQGFRNLNLVAVHPDAGRAVPSFLEPWPGNSAAS